MFLANNVYGKHGGPYQPGTAIGLLFHLLSGGDHELQGFYGHVMGGMGAITQALASRRAEAWSRIRTSASVAQIHAKSGRALGVVLEDGTEIRGRMVLSNADPKRTFLRWFRKASCLRSLCMPCVESKWRVHAPKVNLALSEEPRFTGTPASAHGAGANVLYVGAFARILPSAAMTFPSLARFLRSSGSIA